MKTAHTRTIAAKIIAEVTNGRSLTDAEQTHLKNPQINVQDRSYIKALVYGTCRFYTRLDILLSFILKKPLNESDSDIHALLLIGLYQLLMYKEANYAYVSEAVEASRHAGKAWAAGLINAVLRTFLRDRVKLLQKLSQDKEAKYNHPKWWITKLKKTYKEDWLSILAANDEEPPFSLRINRHKISRTDYLQKLSEERIAAKVLEGTQEGILLDEAMDVHQLPLFDQGYVSVQDGAAQFAAHALNIMPQQSVLDACAAPGGKLMHMLEIAPDASYVAVEKDARRAQKIQENLTRIGAEARVIIADATQPELWNKSLYDRILLDAPCSASGIVRRHPDIKLLRRPEDLLKLAALQKTLLQALWPLLKPNGLLLYATCSIFVDENDAVINAFLREHKNVEMKKLDNRFGSTTKHGIQFLPGKDHMDGFYYALLQKV